MKLNNSVRFVLTEEDRRLLEAIAERNGESNLSLTLRQMIRETAKQNGVEIPNRQNEPVKTT